LSDIGNEPKAWGKTRLQKLIVKADILGYCKSFPSGSVSPSVFLAVRSVFHEQKQLNPCCTRLFACFVLKTILVTFQDDLWLFLLC